MLDEFEKTGRVWLRAFFSESEIEGLRQLCEVGDTPGNRFGAVGHLSDYIGPTSRIANYLVRFNVDKLPVRALTFHKSEGVNWSVPWHQDRVIALAQRREVEGYRGWTHKTLTNPAQSDHEFWQCEAPIELLSKMLFVRIHLDDHDSKNGAMEIAKASHKFGRIPVRNIHDVISRCDIETCCAKPGDVLVTHALILHRSKEALERTNRSVLRVDYAPRALLASELSWDMGWEY